MNNSNDLQQFIAQRVRYFRKLKGLTQEELSEKAQLGLKYINHIENKTYNIKLQTLEKVILALDITPEEFFTFNEKVETKIDQELDKLIFQLNSLSSEEQEKFIVFFQEVITKFK